MRSMKRRNHFPLLLLLPFLSLTALLLAGVGNVLLQSLGKVVYSNGVDTYILEVAG